MFTLRVDQQHGMDLLRRSLGGGKRRPMFQAATGFGKTILGSAIIGGALAKHKRVLFTVPSISLINQTVEKFWIAGIREVGVIQADHPMTNPNMPVQVASVQTLVARGGVDRIPPADLVLIDEAHRWYTLYGEWMAHEAWRRVPFIGLSATPWTKGLGKHYDDLIIPIRLAELIEARLLAPFRAFAPSHPDLSKVRTERGDYRVDDLHDAMDKAPLTADIVDTWLVKGEGRPTLLFAVDRAHAESLRARFEAAGVRAEYADQKTPGGRTRKKDGRDDIGDRLASGQTQVVCNVGVFTTGTDWPFVSCIILARPTKSEMLYLQMIGRGLRTCTGKVDLLVLDHSDTTLRLGFITDVHHEELDDGKKKPKAEKREKKEAALPKECPSCGLLKPPRLRKCPGCGFESKPKSSEGDGELAELVPGKLKADRDTKQKWWSMLTHYAKRRGFKDGWAAHAYREKFGVWPRGLAEVQTEPDVEVLGYIKHKLIKHAKGRTKQAA